MYVALDELLHCLDLKGVGPDHWEGRSPDPDLGHLFGGQVLAQGLVAAHRSLGGGSAHSLHAYFLRRGTPARPIGFAVQSLRAGRSVRTGTVTAVQDDVPILQMTVSYHRDEAGPSHQIPMHAAGDPEGEVYEEALAHAMRHVRGFDAADRRLPVEIRGVGGIGIFSEEIRPPNARCWMRTRGALPDDPLVHQCLFAYASDYAMMMPVLNPHPLRIPAVQNRASTTPSGSTASSAWTSGCSSSWTVPSAAAVARSLAGCSTRRPATSWARACKRACSASAARPSSPGRRRAAGAGGRRMVYPLRS